MVEGEGWPWPMDLNEYQQRAAETDQFPDRRGDRGLMIPLLGLSGEVGTLLAEFKKKVRAKGRYDGFPDRAREELGDILWYLANVASRLELQLSNVATQNLLKNQERWPLPGAPDVPSAPFDHEYPPSERFPRKMRVEIREGEPGKTVPMKLTADGVQVDIGDSLRDNSYDDDGYRYHDVMHLAHLAVLGWSPVLRKFMGKKRRSRPDVDQVEDGGRAMIVEEAVVAFVYADAEKNGFYEHSRHVDSDLLATVKRMVRPFEVNQRSAKDWEQAILQGYAAFRRVRANQGGRLDLDLDARKIQVARR